jgi:hypothetical protein
VENMMKSKRTRIAIAGTLAALIGAVGLAAPSLAESGGADSPTAVVQASIRQTDNGPKATSDKDNDCVAILDAFDTQDDFEGEDFELSSELIAELNAKTDAIVAYLADNGVSVGVETDLDGLRWPDIADEDDATWDLLDNYFEETYGKVEEGLEGAELRIKDLDFELPAEVEACFDQLGEFDDFEFDEFDAADLTEEEVADINAETQGLVDYLADNGIAVDVETDEYGLVEPNLDSLDDASWNLLDEYFEQHYGPFEDFDFEGCDDESEHEDEEDDKREDEDAA